MFSFEMLRFVLIVIVSVPLALWAWSVFVFFTIYVGVRAYHIGKNQVCVDIEKREKKG